MKSKPSFRDILPEYPSILHYPYKSKDENIATDHDISIISGNISFIQEKIDGSNCGMIFIDGHPVVRNRSKILRKGQELKNPSTKQFASAWNWMHERKERFEKLNELGPYSVYGEWMVQQHGMVYDNLPEWFIAYDVYDYEKGYFLNPINANSVLKTCGFEFIELDFQGDLSFQQFNIAKEFTDLYLDFLSKLPTNFSLNTLREGIVIKVADKDKILARFKMVRDGFVQGSLLTDEMKKNLLKGKNNG
jgi:hypothetical protein